MEAKTVENGSPSSPMPASRMGETANNSEPQENIKVTCPNCNGYHDRVNACYYGNTPDDDTCRKERKFVSTPERSVCPDCGCEDLRYGSTDPCEGSFFWCNSCGCGPIRFPLGHQLPGKKQHIDINADRVQLEALLAQGRKYERTGDRRVFERSPLVVGS